MPIGNMPTRGELHVPWGQVNTDEFQLLLEENEDSWLMEKQTKKKRPAQMEANWGAVQQVLKLGQRLQREQWTPAAHIVSERQRVTAQRGSERQRGQRGSERQRGSEATYQLHLLQYLGPMAN